MLDPLSPAEIADLCPGLVQPAAQVRELRRLGLRRRFYAASRATA